MTNRIAAALLLASLFALPGCADALDVLAPKVFYGFASSATAGQLCVSDGRDDEPDRERCFTFVQDETRFEPEQPQEWLQSGTLLKIVYEERDGDEQVATLVELAGD